MSIIFSKKRTFIIAEAGNNHEGSFKHAIKLIDEASKAGADAIKFQTFITDKLYQEKKKRDLKL